MGKSNLLIRILKVVCKTLLSANILRGRGISLKSLLLGKFNLLHIYFKAGTSNWRQVGGDGPVGRRDGRLL